MDIINNLNKVRESIPAHVKLVAVSKTKPDSMVLDLHRAGQVDFGENKVQDLVAKAEVLPESIRWHMVGHLQSNKVKYIAPFVHLIHSVDSLKLLRVIQKEADKNQRDIRCLLQVHIASEESKFGLSEEELFTLLQSEELASSNRVIINGLMGMATFTGDNDQLRSEFKKLKRIFEKAKSEFFSDQDQFREISMGMSGDYKLAVEEGSTMVRVGSLIFGPRVYH